MILSFLFPFPIRGIDAPYLWIFYRQFGVLPIDEVVYIGNEDYFRDPADYSAMGRWETGEHPQRAFGYHLPTYARLAAADRKLIPASVFHELLAELP